MPSSSGAPPKSGWQKMVSEILVEDFEASLEFWCDLLGFEVAYQRLNQHFAYLERPDGAQIMLCQRSGDWETASLAPPYGRGVMFQLYVDRLQPVLDRLESEAWPIYAPVREVWRRLGDREGGQREVFVQDPDGYLIMVAETIGERPLSA